MCSILRPSRYRHLVASRRNSMILVTILLVSPYQPISDPGTSCGGSLRRALFQTRLFQIQARGILPACTPIQCQCQLATPISFVLTAAAIVVVLTCTNGSGNKFPFQEHRCYVDLLLVIIRVHCCPTKFRLRPISMHDVQRKTLTYHFRYQDGLHQKGVVRCWWTPHRSLSRSYP